MNKSCLASAKPELFIVYRSSFIKLLGLPTHYTALS